MTAPAKGPLEERCDFCGAPRMRRVPAVESEALKVRCPYCGAKPAESCRAKDRLIGDRVPCRPHTARVRAARLRQEEGW